MYDMNHNFARVAGVWFFLFCGFIKYLSFRGWGGTLETETEGIVIDNKQLDNIVALND
ncbi:hypothetical protein P4U03_01920 [Bacillus mycoides]|uniref:hypothetical protein n=1 Tax=Bacillus cereus group TaxID=86661 RepID=UPI00159405A2|nr:MULTISPECIES: hypothetical protein [Bacillus cereus group]MED1265450.1 hypothetical protein [Bacillus mycoides]